MDKTGLLSYSLCQRKAGMYKIRGADEKEYGPVTGEQLQQWIAEHRLNAQSLAQLEGTEGWKPLGQFPEFAATLSSAAPAPPGLGPIGPLSTYTPPQPANSMAITGLVLGCLSLVCCQLLGIPGIIFSAIALSQLKQDSTRGGRGLAVAGLILSILGLLFFCLLLAFGAFGALVEQFSH